MGAYLIVDVEDLLSRLQHRSFAIDLHDLATHLRGNAALAAGLFSPDALKAVAVADWTKYKNSGNASIEQVFEGVGFETFNIPDRRHIGSQSRAPRRYGPIPRFAGAWGSESAGSGDRKSVV